MREKNKVGRPRLADRKTKKHALLYVLTGCVLLVLIALFVVVNELDFINIQGKLTRKNFVYYSQLGRHTQFCGRSGKTIGTSGCGVTSMAMVLRNLYGDKKYTPEYTMKEAYKAHYCGSGISGTYWKYFPYAAKKHNLKYYNIPKNGSGVKKIKEILSNGGLVIVNVGASSPFTHGGHYMVLYDLTKSGKVHVANPSRRPKGLDDKTYDLQKDFLNKGWTKNGWWGFMLKNQTTVKAKKKSKKKAKTNNKNNGVTVTAARVNSSQSISKASLLKMQEGKCPVAPSITSVNNATNIFNYRVNTSDLTSQEVDNLYLFIKVYDKNRKVKYTRLVGNKGKSKTLKETIGVFDYPTIVSLKKYLTYDGTAYLKDITFDSYYYIALYSGSKKCYYNYVVTDGFLLKNNYRKYRLANYDIVTSKGIVKGSASNATATSTNERVFKANKDITDLSLKAAATNAYNGSESNVSSTVTISNGNLKGSFKVELPKRYVVTTYLSNPVTGKNNPLPKGSLKKAKYTKNSSGKVYGVELTKNTKTNKNLKVGSKVYAMDSGTVISVRTKAVKKDTYGYLIKIKSVVDSAVDEMFIHSYAHLDKVYVKKGMRVHKGQVIGTVGKTAKKGKKLKKATLFVTIDHLNSSKKSEVLLLNNFVGRNLRYNIVTKEDNNYKLFQSYINDSELCKFVYGDKTCK